MRSFLQRHPLALTLWCMIAAFGTYACMYGFRKPFTAAAFDGTDYGTSLKLWLVSAQVIGYTLSKLIGVKVVSEMTPARRVATLLGLIAMAEAALVFFAVTPAPYNAFWMFMNGLPLGMVFGIVLGFLEGRKMSEVFIAVLCASFILADGFTKSVGAWVLESNISEWWMPAASGALFIVPLLLFLGMLRMVPPPDEADRELRSVRQPMTGAERVAMLRNHGLMLGGIVVAYLLITVMRSLRADFAPEIWKSLGVLVDKEIFTQSEFFVGIVVTLLAAAMSFFRNNRAALLWSVGLCVAGLLLCLSSFTLLRQQQITPFGFMVVLGIGMYIPYVIVHTSVFERFVAFTREKGNIGFLMSVADSAGYIGYCVLLLVKEPLRQFAGHAQGPSGFYGFFSQVSIILLVLATVFMVASFIAALRIKPATT